MLEKEYVWLEMALNIVSKRMEPSGIALQWYLLSIFTVTM